MPLSTSTQVRPFHGYVDTTADALRLIQAARCGLIPRITRRLNEMERRSMIRSGAIFVFSVEESSIKRWTDGFSWTPSRISGNFLVYREVTDRVNRGINQDSSAPDTMQHAEAQVTLKIQGLVKKTITVKIDGSDHHLISYYTQEDVRSGRLRRPTSSPELMALEIPLELVQTTNFRYPPKLEAGPDGRLTKIRDSDDSIEPSECPSPIVRTASRGREVMSENSSDYSQAHISRPDVHSPVMFNHPQRGMRSFEDSYTPPAIHVDLHPSMSAGGLSSPSQAYYTQGMNQDLFSPTTPPHWPNSPYIPYDVPTKPSTHHTYSAESRRVQSETDWHPRSISGSGDLSSDGVRHRRQAGGDGWPSGRVVEGPPLASIPLAHSSEGTTPLPTVRTCEPVRTGSGSSTWSWDDNAHHHQLSSASSGEHPHRTATRISNAADYASRYSTQHR